MRRAAVWLAAALLAGCATNTVGLPYAPSHAVTPTTGAGIAVAPVVDARDDHDATWIGAVRGGFGNPLKVLRTGPPVSEVVREAFRDGLRARGGLAAEDGRATLAVTIQRLDASKLARSEASAQLRPALSRDGRVVYTDTVAVTRQEGSLITFDSGVFASSDDLASLLDRVLSEAVDQALDKPALATAARRG